MHQGQALIGNHEPLVEKQLHPKAITDRAGAKGGVERKQARLNLGDGKSRHRAGEFLGIGGAKPLALARRGFNHCDPIGKVQGGAEAVRQPRLQPLTHHDAVHHHIDVVTELLVQNRRFFQFVELAVHLHPLKALLAQIKKLFLVLALPIANDRRQQIGARPLLHRHHRIHHVLHLHGGDGQASRGRIGRANAGKQQAHIVINLGHRADGRARVFRGGFLLNRNRR